MPPKNNPVGWFEPPVNDLKRAKTFYEGMLALTLRDPIDYAGFQMSFFPMDLNQYGSGGALVKWNGYTPSHAGTTIYFSVSDIETVEKRVQKGGDRVLTPKMDMGSGGSGLRDALNF